MNNFFYILPPILKNISASTVAMIKNRQKYGSYFRNYLKYLKSSKNKDLSTTINRQLEQFIDYACNNSNVYRQFKGCSIREFPVISKNEIIKAGYSNIIGKPYKITHSSGSTGNPFIIPVTKKVYQIEYAFIEFHRSFASTEPGDKIATFGGHKVAYINSNKPPFWIYNYYNNQVIFSSYHLSEKNLKYYCKELNKFRPQILHSYPSSLYLVAKYSLENNFKFNFKPKMIQTGSETLLNFQRKTIETAFNCKVYNWYGNTELCGNITECQYSKLHVQPIHSFIRILNKKTLDAKPGETGRIVATNFNNLCFPLINYDTKDIVKIASDQTCKCGQSGLVIESIDGRTEDYILLPDGRKIGRLDHIFKNIQNVHKAQIVQKKIKTIIIYIDKNNKYSLNDEQKILKETRGRVGNQINIVFNYDTKIEKEANGKFRFIKQNLKL